MKLNQQWICLFSLILGLPIAPPWLCSLISKPSQMICKNFVTRLVIRIKENWDQATYITNIVRIIKILLEDNKFSVNVTKTKFIIEL